MIALVRGAEIWFTSSQAAAPDAKPHIQEISGSTEIDPSSDKAPSAELEESEEELSSLEEEESTGLPAPSETKSFASTYWRPERNDRKGDLSVIDER